MTNFDQWAEGKAREVCGCSLCKPDRIIPGWQNYLCQRARPIAAALKEARKKAEKEAGGDLPLDIKLATHLLATNPPDWQYTEIQDMAKKVVLLYETNRNVSEEIQKFATANAVEDSFDAAVAATQNNWPPGPAIQDKQEITGVAYVRHFLLSSGDCSCGWKAGALLSYDQAVKAWNFHWEANRKLLPGESSTGNVASQAVCRWCAEGHSRVVSSLHPDGRLFVHQVGPDPSGRKVCAILGPAMEKA